MDDLERDLTALAPNVDASAAREVFDTRRGRLRRRRRVTTGLVGVLAAVGLVGGIAAVAGDDDGERVDVGGPTEFGPVEFEVVAEVVPPDGSSRLSLVADPSVLTDLVDAEGSAVDLSTQVVVAMTVHVECHELVGFERDGHLLEPVFSVPAGEACDLYPAQSTTVVVAIERDSLGDADVLHLPADDVWELPEATLDLPSPIDFEVLAMEVAPEARIGKLGAATDPDGLATLWAEAGAPGQPDVDLDERIVVSITIADNSCPPAMAGFQSTAGTSGPVLTPLLVEPPGGCDDPLIPKTFLVAVDRDAVEPAFTLRLPEHQPFHGEVRLDVTVDEPSPPPTVAHAETDEVTFEVLGVAEGAGAQRAQVVTSPAEYEAMWDATSLDGDSPSIDFDEQVVAAVTIQDDACPPELTAFDRDGDTITPVFVEQVTECRAPLIPWTYVVVLDRAPLEPGFALLLPGYETSSYGFEIGDWSTVVRFDGPPPTPECSVIEAFADRILDVGIDYDYEPTDAPAELLEAPVVAFRGVLTGGFTSHEALSGLGPSVGFEVEVTDRLFSGSDAPVVLEREMAQLDVSPAVDLGGFADVATASAGVPVVIVARPGGPAHLEGFVTACDGGPLLGRVGTQGEWADIDTLDELAHALRG